jgi:hypothetical protein
VASTGHFVQHEDVFIGEHDRYWYLGVCGCQADIEAGPYATADEAEQEGRRRYAAHVHDRRVNPGR